MSHIPFPASQFLGKMLGLAASFVPMSRANVALDNILKSFDGTMKRDNARRLLRRVYMHFGQMFFEVAHILRLSHGNLNDYVVFEGEENLHHALVEGRGGFILTAHFGNWELTSAAMSLHFGSGAVIVRPMDFAPMDQLMNMLRSRFGTESISKQRAMRSVLVTLKEKKVVGVMLDQNIDWYDGVFVKFLGRWACTNKGLALMALKTGSPVLPVFPVRQGDGRYRIIIGDEIRLIRTGDKIRDVEENTALFTSMIEKYILAYPDHWFWFHKRWKTRNYCPLPEGYFELAVSGTAEPQNVQFRMTNGK